MINISDELREMIVRGGKLQEFYKGLKQSGEAIIIALESIVERIILNEKKIGGLEEEIKNLKQESKNLKAQHDCLEKRFQEEFPY